MSWWHSPPSMVFPTSWEQGPVSEDGPCSRWEDQSRRPSAGCGGVWRRSGRRAPRSRCLTILVFWRKHTGERTGSPNGISLLNEALELVERTDERWYEAELYRLMAEAADHQLGSKRCRTLASPRASNSAETGREALGIACRRQHGPPLARSSQAHRRPRPAGADLRSFTEGFDTRDLKEVAALLTELA